MSSYRTAALISALENKGFRLERRGSKHLKYFLYDAAGKKRAVRTWVSKGEREYGERLRRERAEQLHLSVKEFEQLVDCSLTGEGYWELLKERGVLEE